MKIIWNDYIKYKAKLRSFELERIEEILRHSDEKYFDTVTHRSVAIGKHSKIIVMILYDKINDSITPVTIHATTRQQIKFRLKSKRFVYE